ncbi:MAG TPA: beta-galactosidase [Candidatus Eisenbergiella stercoravium]|nr:beta-galactosidase [Candidatus Eisenbergiella stercoravium]
MERKRNMKREKELAGCHTLAWKPERLYRGSMEWEEGEEKEGAGGEKASGGAERRALFTCPEEGLDYLLYTADRDGEVRLTDYAFLCLKPEVLEEHSMCFQLSFYENYEISQEPSRERVPEETAQKNASQREEREPDMRIIFGLLPGIRTMVPFDFRILNSQVIFPERTPGRLKMSIFGKPVRLSDVKEIRLQTAPGFETFHFAASECFLSKGQPACELSEKRLIDDLGQWTQKEWKKKVADRQACTHILQELLSRAEAAEREEQKRGSAFPFADWDEYGGWKGKTFRKTGWFHVERENGRYWLADPEGNAFLSAGLDCINPGEGTRLGPVLPFVGENVRKGYLEAAGREEAQKADSGNRPADSHGRSRRKEYDFFNYGVENLKAAFGENWKECWMKIVRYYLCSWGINTIGNWSDREFIRFARLPYVIPMDSFSEEGYPHTENAIFRDFPDVFSPEYEESAERYAKGLAPFASDPLLIGYFMRNEPEWAFVYGLNIAEEMLANPVQTACRAQFRKRMEEKYGCIDRFNEAWNTSFSGFDGLDREIYKAASLSPEAEADLKAFSEEMITRYVEIPAKELRRVDANHLNLGMRYAYLTDKSLLCGSEYFDVFSINSYQITPLEPVEKAAGWLDKPVMVGEFHQGALDVGLTAHGIRGVTNQEQRGCAYRYYLEQGLTHPHFLGAHYFQLNDQSCLGRFDGENYQIGLIDVCMQEYEAMTEAMRACHADMYRVAAGETAAWEIVPEDIEPIHY